MSGDALRLARGASLFRVARGFAAVEVPRIGRCRFVPSHVSSRADAVGGVVRPIELAGPTLLLTVGPAASGKSTLLGRLVAAQIVDEVVSTDVVRAELGLAPDDTETAYSVARRRVRAALAIGQVVAVDATNVRGRDRSAWLAVAAASGARAVALRVGTDLDLEQLVARDAGRRRHVPRRVIADQLALARASTPEVLAAEGFAIAELGAVADLAAASAVSAA